MGKSKVYLPEFDYYDFFTSRLYAGGRTIMMYRTMDELPILIKKGDIIPLTQDSDAACNPKSFEIRCYMGDDGHFEIYEDDNNTLNYKRGIKATTLLKNDWERKKFVLNKVKGELSLIPEKRDYKFIFIGIVDCDIAVSLDGQYIDIDYSYNQERCELSVEVNNVSTKSELIVNFPFELELAKRDKLKDLFILIDRFEIEINLKEILYETVKNKTPLNAVSILNTLDLNKDLYNSIIEILLA